MEKWRRHGLRVSSAIRKHELQTRLAQEKLGLLLLCHSGTRLDGYQSFNKPPQFLFFQCWEELHSLDAGDATKTWASCHRRDNSSNLGARNMLFSRHKDMGGGRASNCWEALPTTLLLPACPCMLVDSIQGSSSWLDYFQMHPTDKLIALVPEQKPFGRN